MIQVNTSLLKSILVSLIFLGAMVPYVVLAALEVTFEETPLFLNADIKPGDVVTRTVTVTNTGDQAEDVIFSLENTFSDGLADVMEMAVISGSDLYADTTFFELFGWGEVDLGALPAQSSKTYEFTAFLDPSVGNAYQRSELGFDLLIGFSGGETVTDSPGSGGGAGGSGLSRNEFELFNETVEVENDTTAVLTWNTNRPGTSYAVCGDEDDGPFILDPDDTLFGYSFGSSEDITKTLAHSVDFSDLAAGTYACRVASREEVEDDFTVSGELQFVITPEGLVAGITDNQPFVQGNIFQPTPAVAGASSWGKGSQLTYEEYRAELDSMKAAREAYEAGQPSLSTSTNRSRPIDNLPAGADAADVTQDGPRYWLWALVSLGALGFGWLIARLRRGGE